MKILKKTLNFQRRLKEKIEPQLDRNFVENQTEECSLKLKMFQVSIKDKKNKMS